MSMTQQDLELCRGLVKVLKSGKNSKFSQMFLNPFDVSHVPGYLDICGRVMDLSTLEVNLENGRYSKRIEVYDDCNIIFENAIKYHSDKDLTKWIVSPAKNMLKVAKREQQKIEKKAANGTGAEKPKSIKLKLGGSGGDSKPKIKIKQPAARATGATISRGKTAPSGVVGASRGKTPPPGGSSSTPGVKDISVSPSSKPPPNKKPRLKLKLGLGKSSETTTSTKKGNASGSGTTSSSSSGTKKISIKTGTSGSVGSVGGPSRGKELPKGVVAPASAGSTKSKTDTKKPTKISKATTSNKKNTATTASKSTASKVTTPKGITFKGATPKAATTKTTTPKSTTPKTATPKSPSSKTTKTTTKSSGTKKEKSTSKAKITLKTSSAYKTNTTNTAGGLPMTPARKAQCSKILNGIKRRKAKSVVWFEKPVSDKKMIQDYRAKIKYPMDLSTMQTKLENTTFGGGSNNKGYTTVAAFVLDLRRIFGNCLRYNTSNGKDSLRPIAVETLEMTDQLSTFFLAKPEFTNNPTANATPLYPPLLFCWKLCVNVIDTLYNLTNREDKHPTAFYFMHPVQYFFGGTLPSDYLHKAPKPMDFGTVTSQLMEGQYTSLDQFESDCNLVLSNCIAYYGGKAENKVFCDQATRLNQVLQQQLDALNRYVKSSAGLAAQKSARMGISTSTLLPKPPIPLLLSILAELRDQKYTDKMTKITEPAMANFEKPVSVAVIPDYMQYVQTPMDLQTVERKIKNVQYATPEDFEYDMILMFQNCITYNGARKVDHLVSLGRFGLKAFRRIFSARMKVFDDPLSGSNQTIPLGMSSTGTSSIRKEPPMDASEQGPSKKIKIDTSGISRGKNAPRISLSAATMSEAQAAATAAAQIQGRKANKLPTAPKVKSNQPVPLHIAIAQVKERFPLRRDIKSLQSWEAACARFFKELKRHPWISAARPKFIFHVPVPVLFPELREAYGAIIKKPMDLTTAECTLLAGNRYTMPDDFVNDVALVFANAISFNKDGKDVGDPLSCAYYDASIHLLKYTRWLSLELLSDYVILDSDQVDEPEEEGIPVKSWKLTEGNAKKARSEMEAIVLNEPIEKSLEGDRYSWMEAECEKLLKSLRHQSDLRYMTFFLTPNYPADYSAFITRPMDWEKVQKTLKKRNYDTSGAVIDDLRLIFTNAFKYNSRLAGTETVSGRAYDSAKTMSVKLETAINKLMVTVSDRVERERIDHNNAEREIEAAERVEEARIRAQWKSEVAEGGTGNGSAPSKVEGSLRARSSIRLSISRRKSDTDFEVPFFEEEYDGQHEQSHVEVMKQQKATFERQRTELVIMRRSTVGIGHAVFNRMMQEELALKWVEDEQKKLGITVVNVGGYSETSKKDSAAETEIPSASSVSAKLAAKGRNPLKMNFSISKRKKKVQKRTQAHMDWDDESDD